MWPFKKKKPTICKECRFYLSIKGQIENCNWQPIFPKIETDFVTGKEIVVEAPKANCYERNQGNCKYWFPNFPPPPAPKCTTHIVTSPLELKIIKDCEQKLIDNTIELDPKITEYLNEHFWELFDEPKTSSKDHK